jgi:hypothetical protein
MEIPKRGGYFASRIRSSAIKNDEDVPIRTLLNTASFDPWSFKDE